MADTLIAPSTQTSAPAVAPTEGVSRVRVYTILALGILCIALSAIFVKLAGVPGTVSAFYRVAIAAVVLALPFARNVARRKVVRDWRIWALAAAAGIFFVLDIAVWNTSLFMTSAANATLLGNDAPLIVGFGALLLFHERLKVSYWSGLAIALVGMAVIVGPDAFGNTGQLGAGDLLSMLAGVFYAMYLLATQRIRVRMDTLASLWVAGVVGAVLLLGFNLISGYTLWGFAPRQYLALLGLGLISQVVGWLAINYALGHLPASIVSVTLLTQPVLTAIFAVLILGEALEGRQIVGGVVTLAGIYLVNRGFAK